MSRRIRFATAGFFVISGPAMFSLAQPCVTFGPTVSTETVGYGQPTCVAVGDIDNDGLNDLFIASRTSTGVISIRRGLATGGYGADEIDLGFTTANMSNWCDLADFNMDGNLDVVLGTREPGRVEIHFGHGDGTFSFFTSTSSYSTTTCVRAADFTGDGKPEILLSGIGGARVLQLLPSGELHTLFVRPGSQITYPDFADFDGDGDLDLLLPSTQDQSIFVYQNDGSGAFSLHETLQLASGTPTGVRGIDIDSDGDVDVAVADIVGTVQLFEQHANGTFGDAQVFPVPSSSQDPWHLTAADFNNDGRVDLAYAGAVTHHVGVLVNRSDPGYIVLPPAMRLNVSGFLNMVAVDDMDRDGDIDIIVGSLPSGVDHPINFIENTTAGTDCYADATGDGTVDIADVVEVFLEWNKTKSHADLNKDLIVNSLDLVLVLNNWGEL